MGVKKHFPKEKRKQWHEKLPKKHKVALEKIHYPKIGDVYLVQNDSFILEPNSATWSFGGPSYQNNTNKSVLIVPEPEYYVVLSKIITIENSLRFPWSYNQTGRHLIDLTQNEIVFRELSGKFTEHNKLIGILYGC